MTKYIRYGNPKTGIAFYVITMFKTERRNYKVEVIPCNDCGLAISDPVAWDIFPDWWSAIKYFYKQYKDFYDYVNGS